MRKIDTQLKNYITSVDNGNLSYSVCHDDENNRIIKCGYGRIKSDRVLEPEYTFGATVFGGESGGKKTMYVTEPVMHCDYPSIYVDNDKYTEFKPKIHAGGNYLSSFDYATEHSRSHLNFAGGSNVHKGEYKLSVILIIKDGGKETIDTILKQNKNCELIILDNCSSVAKDFDDPRIIYRYFKEDVELALLKNYGLSLATGEYVAFATQGTLYDSPFPLTFEGDMCIFQQEEDEVLDWHAMHKNKFFSDYDILSVSVIRKSAFIKLPFFFEQYYVYNEDTKFLCTALSHGLRITLSRKRIASVVGLQIRRFPEIKIKCCDWINRLYSKRTEWSDLTVVLAFYNESSEVEKTVQSIRATSDKFIPIVLVNDCSDDGYDYRSIADIYNCTYHELPEKYGSSMAKNYGVSKVNTEYFILLDAHMRFYENGWDTKMIEEGLSKYRNAVFCSQCFTIKKRYELDTHVYDKEYWDKTWFLNHGAFFGLGIKKPSIQAWWGAEKIYNDSWTGKNVIPVTCIMGASYATSKTWWDYIHGYDGLRGYGDEEFFVSMKTWQAGGCVMMFKNIGIGHVAKFYYSSASNYDFNHYIDYYIAKVCGEDEFFDWFVRYNSEINHHWSKKWLDFLDDKEVRKEVEYQRSIRKHDMKWVLQQINGRSLNKNHDNEYCGRNQDGYNNPPYDFFLTQEEYDKKSLNFSF